MMQIVLVFGLDMQNHRLVVSENDTVAKRTSSVLLKHHGCVSVVITVLKNNPADGRSHKVRDLHVDVDRSPQHPGLVAEQHVGVKLNLTVKPSNGHSGRPLVVCSWGSMFPQLPHTAESMRSGLIYESRTR